MLKGVASSAPRAGQKNPIWGAGAMHKKGF